MSEESAWAKVDELSDEVERLRQHCTCGKARIETPEPSRAHLPGARPMTTTVSTPIRSEG